MKFIIFLIFLFSSAISLADNSDPNGFFKDRNWNINVKKGVDIVANSKYLGEPVQRPNQLIAHLKCGKSKKQSVELLNKMYCGINYMKVIGAKLEIMFLDYSSKNSRGYCTKKKIRQFKIPACPAK